MIVLTHSAHRRQLDRRLNERTHLYRGVVLDIGGRNRGSFRKPKEQAARWIVYDLEARHAPDVVGDVAEMATIASGSIDVVSAIELFEHVSQPTAGIRECARVLKRGGTMVLSSPFVYPVHGDPYDYQRWTEHKWRQTLAGAGFTVEEFVVLGRIFTVLSDTLRDVFVDSSYLRFTLGLPLLLVGHLLERLDATSFVLDNPRLARYHGGYFIVARKEQDDGDG